MENKNEKFNKKAYQKPAVIYAKKIEVIAVPCLSPRGGFSGCRKPADPCIRLYD